MVKLAAITASLAINTTIVTAQFCFLLFFPNLQLANVLPLTTDTIAVEEITKVFCSDHFQLDLDCRQISHHRNLTLGGFSVWLATFV